MYDHDCKHKAKKKAAEDLRKNSVTITIETDDPAPMKSLIKALTKLLPKGMPMPDMEEEKVEEKETDEDPAE